MTSHQVRAGQAKSYQAVGDLAWRRVSCWRSKNGLALERRSCSSDLFSQAPAVAPARKVTTKLSNVNVSIMGKKTKQRGKGSRPTGRLTTPPPVAG
jgi:hypothetical protein